ncbi:MAG: hypothetical protein AAF492_16480 [Verrucomicrobiota bacterium]
MRRQHRFLFAALLAGFFLTGDSSMAIDPETAKLVERMQNSYREMPQLRLISVKSAFRHEDRGQATLYDNAITLPVRFLVDHENEAERENHVFHRLLKHSKPADGKLEIPVWDNT